MNKILIILIDKGMRYESKYAIQVIVWVGLSVYGSTDPYFVEKGQTVNTATYCNKFLPFA